MLYRRALLLALCLTLVAFSTALASHQVDDANTTYIPAMQGGCQTNVVVQNTDDDGIGSLRQALIDACSVATITFASPLFNTAQTITLGGTQLLISKNLTIIGPGEHLLTISGNNASRVIQVGATSNSGVIASLSKLTITGGNGLGIPFNGQGGGIDNQGTLTLTNVIVTANGFSVSPPGCGGCGGGINNSGTLSLINSQITNNTTPLSAAGIYSGGTLTMTGSTVANNTNSYACTSNCGWAGGIENHGTATITNSTISGNHANNGAGSNAGGIWSCCGALTITSSTITGNTAGGATGQQSAGGLYRDGSGGGSVTVKNTLIAGNSGTNGATTDVSGTFSSSGYNLIGNGTGATGFTGTADQVGTSGSPINPMLGALDNNGGPTQTHALLTGSPAIDKGNAFSLTTDQRGTGFNRTVDVSGITNASDGTDIGAFEYLAAPTTDRPAVWRTGTWYLHNSLTNGPAETVFLYGLSSDTPLLCDWNGDGVQTPGVVRSQSGLLTWYLRNANSAGPADLSFTFGLAGDIPLCGDWDGNGSQTPGVYRGTTFYLRNANAGGGADITALYGQAGDKPVVGNWDGLGGDTIGVFRPSNGGWYLKNTNASGGSDLAFSYGLANDKPVTGDWDNDGDDTPGVVRSANWYLRNSNSSGSSDIAFTYGASGDTPLVWR